MWIDAIPHRELTERIDRYIGERPHLLSPRWRAESFRAAEGEAMTVRRAKALNAVLDACDLPVWPGELIVGCKFQCFGSEYEPDDQARDREYLGKIGARGFCEHSDHHAPDYPLLLEVGFGGLKERIERSLLLRARNGNHPSVLSDAERCIEGRNHLMPEVVPPFDTPSEEGTQDRRVGACQLAPETDLDSITFLGSMAIAIDGASRYMRRYAERLRQAASGEREYAELLGAQAEMFEHLSENSPRTFHEAIQLVYSFHTMMQMDDRYAMAFGRLDQYLYPFYRRDIDEGRLTDETALRILEHFFAKITVDGDVQNIAIGGVKPEDGSDAVNELSYLILDTCGHVGRPGGNVTARITRTTPMAFLEKCAEVIRTGVGYPAVVNDEVMVPALTDLGIPLEDARDYCFVGCIETAIAGKTAPWADSRFNLLQCVNLALFDGMDTVANRQVGPQTGDPETWEGFYDAYLEQMRHQLRLHIAGLDAAKAPTHARAQDFTSPLMSTLTSDCIERGRDLNNGGARYPANHGVAGMGIGVTADALMTVKHFVYDEQRRFTLADLRRMLNANFDGFERERLMLLKEAPKYGNDVDEVDDIAAQAARDFGNELLKYRTPQGGFYWGLMAANVQNISAGAEIGATPDGRLAFQPVSDAASPTFGRDVSGITSTLRSVAKLPYGLCHGGNVVNVKLHPTAIEGEAGLKALAVLIRACFDLGGAELQFNAVDGKTLRDAMERPQEYRDLVVRVSGFSARYTTLDRVVQEDILARTEHGSK